MDKTGVVIDSNNNHIDVLVVRESGCGGNCSSCTGCSSENKPMIVKIENELNAKKGDRVLLSIKNGTIFKYSIIMYFIPLIFFVFGIISGIIIFSGNNVSSQEIKSLGLGIVFLLISLFILKILDNKYFNKNSEVIKAIKIINFEEE